MGACVSKKKYLEMEGYKNRAESRVVVLTKEVADLKQEFNSYNNKFNYNNAEKDMMIDSLAKEIAALNSDILSSTESIEDQTFSFQVEKRRLNQMLADKDREIRNLQRASKALNIKVEDLQTKVFDLNSDLKAAQNQVGVSESLVAQQENKVERLMGQLSKQRDQLAALQNELAGKDEKINALSNQVKLLKSQFGQQGN